MPNPGAVPVGQFIRERVIPVGMTVTEAARTLGVGRPALSNLLNGKAALSPEMALRLEQAFGADRQQLLALQAEGEPRGGKDVNVAARSYVPSFLSIKARQLHGWAEANIDTRRLLPVLVRKLVHSTGRELRRVDFAGYDNAERKGWDGFVDAGCATPWIPEGLSGWEMGASKDPARKAESDYAARTASVPASERSQLTFVFVTPRNWAGKVEWVRAKSALGEWSSVRAFDASDLEQWIENSIGAQIWLAEQLNLPTTGFRTLESCWSHWADASEPRLRAEIFAPSIERHAASFERWISEPPTRPFVVAADSREEALGFLACLVREKTLPQRTQDTVAVFDSAPTLRQLAASSAPFLPIVCTAECERELATLYRRIHCITVRPRNAVESEPDIAVDLLSHDAFESAVIAMGIDRASVEALARDSGLSPTILRRRLSRIPAIRTPVWAGDLATARALTPMALVGVWQGGSNADREILANLAGRSYSELEEEIARLLQFDDCPVWSVGRYRGVASKIDVLFATAWAITPDDLETFFFLAEYVLSESDPALDLPEEKRWFAQLYGKVRDHSPVLREGICETLVVLSVHGVGLFPGSLGAGLLARVGGLVRRLLTPLTMEKLLSHDRDLARLAEAAPHEFLSVLEEDLRGSEPAVYGLLKPAQNSIFGNCPRAQLLWSLECLAWTPRNLVRVSTILGQLSRIRIDDNWGNKPIASLNDIYRAWMPQTAASLDERIKALETLIKRYPDIGWSVCIDQFDPGSTTGSYTSRPRWRSDASGAGQPVVGRERYGFVRKALDLAIGWPNHDENTLADLVERLQWMSDRDQMAVWDRVDAWTEATRDSVAKASLRERIRRSAFTRRAERRGLKAKTRDRAREAYERLLPKDLVARHSWLFASQWVEESASELQDENYDHHGRAERIHGLRVEAVREIWLLHGVDGIAQLSARSEAPVAIGHALASLLVDIDGAMAFVDRFLQITGQASDRADGCMRGFVHATTEAFWQQIFSSVKRSGAIDNVVRILKCGPFSERTWRLLAQADGEASARYWCEVVPYWNRHTDAELLEVIDRLLEVNRPCAAFHVVSHDWERVETSRLKRLLHAVGTSNEEPKAVRQMSDYEISDALNALDGRAGVSVDDMAQFEFMFIGATDHESHGIPNLERQLVQVPSLFVQAVALAYGRRDGGKDPDGWRIEEEARRVALARGAHRLLDRISQVPGTEEDGTISADVLQRWLREARQLCAHHGRTEIGDQCIGQWLSRVRLQEDGVWPCRAICEAMEAIASEHLAIGFRVGTANSRGVHCRAEGGSQERELSDVYRDWGRKLAFEFPYVSSILEEIAVSYDREADWHDSEMNLRRRIGN